MTYWLVKCQMVNFVILIPPLYTADTSSSCSYALFLQNKDRINKFWNSSVVNQIQDKAINRYDNFWSISTLQINKKLYITHLQFSYLIKLYFPYDINYLPNGCEANVITFVLPSNNKLNVEPIIETNKYKVGFNRSYLKINNFKINLIYSFEQSPNFMTEKYNAPSGDQTYASCTLDECPNC